MNKDMFNKEKLQEELVRYKSDFANGWWENEKYKWEAIKSFQENWNIDASNFPNMLEKALSPADNLLASKNYYPRNMIIELAQDSPKQVRGMFRSLFDEKNDVVDRILEFCVNADNVHAKYGKGKGKHYQDIRATSTYLWLHSPDKCYMYKHSEVKNVAACLEYDYPFTQGSTHYKENLKHFYTLYNEVCDYISKDVELINLLKSKLTDSCYVDPVHKALTTDVCYNIAQNYHKNKAILKEVAIADDNADFVKDSRPQIWKISHGTDATGVKKDLREKFAERQVVAVNGVTESMASSKISQGKMFTAHIKKGDYFYLCYGNSIQLLGQFTSDEAVPNKEIGGTWYEREYQVLAKSKNTSAFKNETKKWWTPNFNSTCISVSEEEQLLFEKLILKPYFGMTLEDLFYPKIDEPIYEKYSKQDFLNEVYMSEAKYDEIVAVLKNKKNIILQGAPGVGKTFAANRLAYSIMGQKDKERVEFVQFHQNYTYEDFIMGYKPSGEGFSLKTGVFHEFCTKAANQPNKDFFFIIDEINRGNMSKIFGELLMLIESDYRGEKISLAYDERPFSVPRNLYIIGMMNTADRSLAMIDYALRRRFSFVEISPAYDSKGFKKYQEGLANETFDKLIDTIRELNRDISTDGSLGRGFSIGHSYVCNWKECTPAKLTSVVEYDILPMLEEYWFDEEAKLNKWKDRLRSVVK